MTDCMSGLKRPSVLFFTIYDHPADYPEHFVARSWLVEASGQVMSGADDVETFDTLEAARASVLASGCRYCLERDLSDDPKIVESWV